MRRQTLHSALTFTLAMLFGLAAVSTPAIAGKGHGGGGHSKGHGGGGHGKAHGGGGHGGYKQGGYGPGGKGYYSFGLSPYGISYGYHGGGISVRVGGPYGYNYGYSRDSYWSPSYDYQPGAYYQAFPTIPAYTYDAVPTYSYEAPPEAIDERPIQPGSDTESQRTASSIIVANERAAAYQSAAERAFREQRYEDATRLASHAVVEDPENGRLHLFQSQAFFAVGDYRGAADSIRKALPLLDVNEWGFVVENGVEFYSGRDYVTQMERLVERTKQNPDVADLYFLRGYHYLYLGYKDAAQRLFAKALELDGADDLTRRLLAMTNEELPPPPVPEELPLSAAGDTGR